MFQYNCCKTKQMAFVKLLENVFKNGIKHTTGKLYRYNVHKNNVSNQSPRKRSQTQMHTVVNDNPMNFQGDGVG